MTESWYRNPNAYIRELVETGEHLVAWDRGILIKMKIDPIKHAELYFGKAYPWRALCIGNQGTSEYRDGDTLMKPTGVYPTWEYGEDANLLEELVSLPVGEDIDICSDTSVPSNLRPVLGQEHRVIITGMPSQTTGSGRAFMMYLKALQEDYPHCIIHTHGMYSYRMSFGMGIASSDTEPRLDAQKGKVRLPQGKVVQFEAIAKTPKWATVLGFKPVDLAVPRNRCMYNIKSAKWAAENYDLLYNFKTNRTDEPVDIESSDGDFVPNTKKSSPLSAGAVAVKGDKFLCNTCSLSDKCTYFREGSVCSVPGAEPKELASFFKTRNADTIIDGLGTLAAANVRRLETGMQYEEVDGELSGEVTKIMGQVFEQGTKLAKLLDPGLRSGAKVQIAIGNVGNQQAAAAANPRQLIATAIRELEQQGYKREDITPEMIQGLLEGMQNPENQRRAIEGHAIEVN